jgi:hypothetical protein
MNDPKMKKTPRPQVTVWTKLAGVEAVMMPPKVGRNDPCICGSGKKLKRCCGEQAASDARMKEGFQGTHDDRALSKEERQRRAKGEAPRMTPSQQAAKDHAERATQREADQRAWDLAHPRETNEGADREP